MAADIRILIADDHPLLRKGLRQMIEAVPHLRVIGEADDGEAALEQIVAQQPDVVVLDIDMPKLDGFGVARELARRRIPSAIIFLTLHASEEPVHRSDGPRRSRLHPEGERAHDDRRGRQGRGGGTVLRDAVAHVAARSAIVPARVPCPQRQPGLAALTPTERKILKLVAAGHSSKDIAGQLFVHYRTVENHRVSIAQKLGLQGHNAVLKFALQHRNEL